MTAPSRDTFSNFISNICFTPSTSSALNTFGRTGAVFGVVGGSGESSAARFTVTERDVEGESNDRCWAFGDMVVVLTFSNVWITNSFCGHAGSFSASARGVRPLRSCALTLFGRAETNFSTIVWSEFIRMAKCNGIMPWSSLQSAPYKCACSKASMTGTGALKIIPAWMGSSLQRKAPVDSLR